MHNKIILVAFFSYGLFFLPVSEFELMHVDEFIDELLHAERMCDIILPRLQVCFVRVCTLGFFYIPALLMFVCVCVCVYVCARVRALTEETSPGGGRDVGPTYQRSGGRPG